MMLGEWRVVIIQDYGDIYAKRTRYAFITPESESEILAADLAAFLDMAGYSRVEAKDLIQR